MKIGKEKLVFEESFLFYSWARIHTCNPLCHQKTKRSVILSLGPLRINMIAIELINLLINPFYSLVTSIITMDTIVIPGLNNSIVYYNYIKLTASALISR